MTLPSLAAQIFLDSSAIYAEVGWRDPNHLRARSIERQLRRANVELVTSNFVVAEAHALILGRENRALALSTLHYLDSGGVSVIRIDEEDELAARRILERYSDKDFSLVDATSFVVMDALSIRTAFAFDENFRQYGFVTL